MKYYLKVLRQYADFSGRARRSEFWYFVLFNFIAGIIASAIDNALRTTYDYDSTYTHLHYGYIYLFYSLAVFIPSLAVTVRRLHDIGKSGWYILVALIPFFGWIWIIVLLCTDSQDGMNQYGPNPKGIDNIDEIDQIGNYL